MTAKEQIVEKILETIRKKMICSDSHAKAMWDYLEGLVAAHDALKEKGKNEPKQRTIK